ncbi:DUF1853 family protein [Balneatrix alpica]|uniref:DUF1853 family protein n=1 Tax=Balneatrix alpica TaxID=75684 RepID=A0ABV5Z9P4_9GAMM|nr:DUF1853 family protein [Balneatrix alpica]
MLDSLWQSQVLTWLSNTPDILLAPPYTQQALPSLTAPESPLVPLTYPLPLGRMVEQLHNFAPQHYPLQLHNLCIRAEGHTLGELDLLLGDPNGQVLHLELAAKWYLWYPQQSIEDLDAWIGPNPHDSLGRKWRRLLQHQLALTQHPYVAAFLASWELNPNKVSLRIPGRLHLPWQHNWRQHPLPPPLNPAVRRGWWLTHGDTPLLPEQGHYWLLSKAQWLSEVAPATPPLTLAELQQQLQVCRLPQQVCLFDQDELSWGFIVNQHWPFSAPKNKTLE